MKSPNVSCSFSTYTVHTRTFTKPILTCRCQYHLYGPDDGLRKVYVFHTVRFGRIEKAKATTGKVIGGDKSRLLGRDG